MHIFFLAMFTRRSLLLAALLFIVSLSLSLAIVSFIVVKLPADYFKADHERKFWSGHHPAVRVLGLIAKNILGIVLVCLGIVMSIPGVPGQGILTILLGIMLLDFPGRAELERKIVSQPRVFKSINKLRQKFGKPGLVL